MGEDAGPGPELQPTPLKTGSELVACAWCGEFSPPGPACEVCGSPLPAADSNPWASSAFSILDSDSAIAVIPLAQPPPAPRVRTTTPLPELEAERKEPVAPEEAPPELDAPAEAIVVEAAPPTEAVAIQMEAPPEPVVVEATPEPVVVEATPEPVASEIEAPPQPAPIPPQALADVAPIEPETHPEPVAVESESPPDVPAQAEQESEVQAQAEQEAEGTPSVSEEPGPGEAAPTDQPEEQAATGRTGSWFRWGRKRQAAEPPQVEAGAPQVAEPSAAADPAEATPAPPDAAPEPGDHPAMPVAVEAPEASDLVDEVLAEIDAAQATPAPPEVEPAESLVQPAVDEGPGTDSESTTAPQDETSAPTDVPAPTVEPIEESPTDQAAVADAEIEPEQERGSEGTAEITDAAPAEATLVAEEPSPIEHDAPHEPAPTAPHEEDGGSATAEQPTGLTGRLLPLLAARRERRATEEADAKSAPRPAAPPNEAFAAPPEAQAPTAPEPHDLDADTDAAPAGQASEPEEPRRERRVLWKRRRREESDLESEDQPGTDGPGPDDQASGGIDSSRGRDRPARRPETGPPSPLPVRPGTPGARPRFIDWPSDNPAPGGTARPARPQPPDGAIAARAGGPVPGAPVASPPQRSPRPGTAPATSRPARPASAPDAPARSGPNPVPPAAPRGRLGGIAAPGRVPPQAPPSDWDLTIIAKPSSPNGSGPTGTTVAPPAQADPTAPPVRGAEGPPSPALPDAPFLSRVAPALAAAMVGKVPCSRCGEPSERGLCEACLDAIRELRTLSSGFSDL